MEEKKAYRGVLFSSLIGLKTQPDKWGTFTVYKDLSYEANRGFTRITGVFESENRQTIIEKAKTVFPGKRMKLIDTYWSKTLEQQDCNTDSEI